jgi:hypothetical protein
MLADSLLLSHRQASRHFQDVAEVREASRNKETKNNKQKTIRQQKSSSSTITITIQWG